MYHIINIPDSLYIICHQADNVHRCCWGIPWARKATPQGSRCWCPTPAGWSARNGKSMFLAGFLKRIQENVVSIGVLLKDQVYPNLEVVPFVGKTCSSHARRSINFWVISHISQVFKKGINKFVAFYWKPQIKLKKLFYHICDLLFFGFLLPLLNEVPMDKNATGHDGPVTVTTSLIWEIMRIHRVIGVTKSQTLPQIATW